MYVIKRVSTVPNSPLKISIDQPDGGDGGFQQGGVYYFQPAGQEGDQHQVSEHAATVIMKDRGLAPHFTCSPALPGDVADATEPDSVAGGRRRSKAATAE